MATKRALITSGGGAKGAFSVGALSYMAKNGLSYFDCISGTSTGSLIAAMTAIGNVKLLEDIYKSVNNDDILKKQNIVYNLTHNRPYIFDTEPLRQMIERHIDYKVAQQILTSDTTLCLTAISLQTGLPTVFTNKDLPATARYKTFKMVNRRQLVDGMLASSSQAAFLPPVTIKDPVSGKEEQFVDGGNREVIPTRAAIDFKPDEIYILSNNPSTLIQNPQLYDGLLSTLMRAVSIFVQDVRENDMQVLNEYVQRNKAKVFVIEPDYDLDPENPTGLRFDQDLMAGWMTKGRMRAKKILESPPINGGNDMFA